MPYEVHTAPGDEPEAPPTTSEMGTPLWEVFVRARRGLSHVHAGSLHAHDAESALEAARDVYTRRTEGISIWVVPSTSVVASDPAEADDFFGSEKPYLHPTFYNMPDEVGHI